MAFIVDALMFVSEAFVLFTIILGIALSSRQFGLAWKVWSGNSANLAATSGVNPVEWPTVTILIPAHNEERVIAGCLGAMTRLEYPANKLNILIVNDRSTDGTPEIADRIALTHERVRVLHRLATSVPGKAAAVADGMALSNSDIIVLFDADYLPAPGLLKQLVAPFSDPTIGATMGRVVPLNSDTNILTRLLDLERRAGYAADQQGRALWELLPQFGGTVGGIRRAALEDVGGWKTGHLAEDTDLSFRLALNGWRIAYLNNARCYEEVPEDWKSRFRQVRRWSYGHNQCLTNYWADVMRSKSLGFATKIDATLILLFYLFPACVLLSTILSIPVLAFGAQHSHFGEVLSWLCLSLPIAILAPYTQVMVSAISDRQKHVIKSVPLLLMSSGISLLAGTAGLLLLLQSTFNGMALSWDKTRRYRSA